MALRPWRGVLATENVQTGDGRIIAPGALEWAPLPLPLAWLERQQHGDLLDGGTQIGTIETISRAGDDLAATGMVDDEIPEGAELVRRLAAGSASNGHREGLSIDPDNWRVELYDTTVQPADGANDQPAEGDVLLLVASGSGPLPPRRARPELTAAAGDPDAGTDSGELWFTDEAGALLERYTRLRVRGVTACSIAAFVSGYMELDPAGAEPAGGAPPQPAPARIVVASAAPAHPPRAYFELPEPTPEMRGMVDVYGMPAEELLIEQPDGGLGVPCTITDDGRVFGHAALWNTCHVGYLEECVTAPPSMAAYAHFHHGSVVCDDGSALATGVLTANCDHAAAHMLAPEARDHYAHSGMGWADVRATNGALGVWISGALRPNITDAQLRVLRASSLSGDWRRIGVDLEFIAALSVNVPGFPIAREHVVASGLHVQRASLAASAHVDNGQVMSLVASGVVQRCTECARRRGLSAALSVADDPRLDQMLGLLHKVELRTRHLVEPAAQHARSRLARR